MNALDFLKVDLLRVQKGISKKRFCEDVGLYASHYNQYLNKTSKVSPTKYAAIATFLAVPLESLLGDEEDSTINPLLLSDNMPTSRIITKHPDTIANTPALRERIKDAMLDKHIRNATDLSRKLNYDAPKTIERLLAGKLNWFPDILSAMLDYLEISHDEAPMTPTERMLLAPQGIYRDGAILIRPIPVVDWSNAAGYMDCIAGNSNCVNGKWDPETTETIAAPVGMRKGTLAFKVHGLSMEPSLHDGDVILCEPTPITDIPNGKIVVIRFGDTGPMPDTVVCKRFRKVSDSILLTSDNPAGREIQCSPQDIAWSGIVRSKQSTL